VRLIDADSVERFWILVCSELYLGICGVGVGSWLEGVLRAKGFGFSSLVGKIRTFSDYFVGKMKYTPK
jgi:uncharacterized membrane protein